VDNGGQEKAEGGRVQRPHDEMNSRIQLG